MGLNFLIIGIQSYDQDLNHSRSVKNNHSRGKEQFRANLIHFFEERPGLMNQPLLKMVDCIRIYAPDLDAALDFYRDRLGLSLVWRSEGALGLRLLQTDTELVVQKERGSIEVDFLVESADQAASEIEKAGGKVIQAPFNIQVGRCARVQDPWGNELVVLDMSKGRLRTDEAGNILGNIAP